MKNLILLGFVVSVMGCGISKTAKETKGIAKESGQRLARVERNSTLLEMKRDLFAPENTRVLAPIPFNMMLPGRRLAQNLTADECVEYISLLISEIREDQEAGARSPQEFDHAKEVRIAAIGIISGMLPRATAHQILVRNVYSPSAFREGALAILVFRARFLNDNYIRNAILDRKIDSSGQIAKAIERADELDLVATLPFMSSLKVKFNSFADPAKNRVVSYDPQEAGQIWVEIARKADSYDPNKVAQFESNKQVAEQKVAQETAVMKSHQATIANRIARWGLKK